MSRVEECNTITEINVGLLYTYADILEASDARMQTTVEVYIRAIYEIAVKAHILLGGKASMDRINVEADKMLASTKGQDPYLYRQQLCEALMTAVIATTGFHIPWDAYLQTAARAQVWLAYLEVKRDEKEAS